MTTNRFEFKRISNESHIYEMKYFVDGKNICLYKRETDKEYRTTRGNLDELISYLKDLPNILSYDMPFHYDVEGECAAELDNNAIQFETDNEEEFEWYYDRLNEWGYKHSWHHASGGTILPDVFFRRMNDSVEISWWSDQEEEGIEFKYKYGFSLIPYNDFLHALHFTITQNKESDNE